VIIAALSLFATTGWYFSNATKLSEATQNINRQQEEYDKDKENFEKLIADMQKRMEYLENVINSSEGSTP
jgi:prefoldin subunit 5